MTTLESAMIRAQRLGAIFGLGEHGQVKVKASIPLPGDLMEELKKHKAEISELLREGASQVPTSDHSAAAALNKEDIASVFFTEEERRRWLILEVRRPDKYPYASVRLGPASVISDVPKFIDTTLHDLVQYVLAKNARRRHWAKNLIDEKLNRLSRCGVDAEIRPLQQPYRRHEEKR